MSLYNALFIILNNVGQVVAWQFAKTTSINETSELISCLFERFQKSKSHCESIYVDAAVLFDTSCSSCVAQMYQ